MLKRHQTTSVTLTDLQILGCELHENAFGGRALPGPAGGPLAVIRGAEGGERRLTGKGIGTEGRGLGKGVGRDGPTMPQL